MSSLILTSVANLQDSEEELRGRKYKAQGFAQTQVLSSYSPVPSYPDSNIQEGYPIQLDRSQAQSG